MNYYNEFDPFAAAWLRELIKAGEIPDGLVDERSIEDIAPNELAGFAQCHFFAGIGGWPLALRQAGVPADRPLWTGSCPCQPFSAAGKGGGFADERHLWPAFDWLIGQSGSDLVLGEQVEGSAGRAWLDLVATDLEGHGYAFGTVVFPAAGVGAPQIRHRTYWVADAEGYRRDIEQGVDGVEASARIIRLHQSAHSGGTGRLADADEGQRGRLTSSSGGEPDRQTAGRQQGDGSAGVDCEAGRLADAHDTRPQGRLGVPERAGQRTAGAGSVVSLVADASDAGRLGWGPSEAGAAGEPSRLESERLRDASRLADAASSRHTRTVSDAEGNPRDEARMLVSSPDYATGRPSPVNDFWRASDWLYCRDGKWRPVEPGTFPLASGVPNRVGRLRGYGNAICVPQAVAFIEAVLDA